MDRASLSHRVVFFGFLGSIVCALAFAGFTYFREVRYQPAALRRLPSEMTSLARLDVRQGVVYAPFREHLLGLLELGRVSKPSRLQYLEQKTGSKLGVETREIVFAQSTEGAWLLIVGGNFLGEKILETVFHMLSQEGIFLERREKSLEHQSGLSFGIAPDGSLILASAPALLEPALSLGPPLKKNSFLSEISGDDIALAVQSSSRESQGGKTAGLLKGRMRVRVGESFPVQGNLSLLPAGGNKQTLERWLRTARFEEEFLVSGQKLTIFDGEEGRFDVEGDLSRAEFEEAVGQLARKIRGVLPSADTPRY